MRQVPYSPKVIYLQPRGDSGPIIRRGNKTNYEAGKVNGELAQRASQPSPDSIRGAWIDLKKFGYHVEFNDPAGLKLDGRFTSLDELMKLTNRVRRENGLSPVGKKKEWLV